MKKTTVVILTIIFSTLAANCQTTKKVHTFPEEYVGRTITFKNIRYWPILVEFGGYYTVQIDISSSVYTEAEWGFQTLNKIIGVVGKDIAKQMINKEIGGYNMHYYGTVTGTIMKSDKVFGSHYIFLMTKLVNHPPDEPNDVIEIFQKSK